MLLHTGSESNMFPLIFFIHLGLNLYILICWRFSLLDKYEVLVAVQCGSQETVPHLVGNANGMRTSRMSQQWALFLSDYFSEDFFWNTFFIGFCIVYFVIIIRLLIKKKTYIFDSLSVAITLCSNCYTFCGCNFRRLMTLWQRCSHLKDTQWHQYLAPPTQLSTKKTKEH